MKGYIETAYLGFKVAWMCDAACIEYLIKAIFIERENVTGNRKRSDS